MLSIPPAKIQLQPSHAFDANVHDVCTVVGGYIADVTSYNRTTSDSWLFRMHAA